MLRNCSWFLHVLCESPSPFSPCSESRQAGKVGGRATFFLSFSLWSLLTAARWGLGLLPQPHPGRFSEDLVRAHGPQNWSNPNIKKRALTKKSRCLLSLSTCVNICGIPVHMTNTCAPFNGLKSIISDGRFLSGPNCDYARHMAWPTGCYVKLNRTQIL